MQRKRAPHFGIATFPANDGLDLLTKEQIVLDVLSLDFILIAFHIGHWILVFLCLMTTVQVFSSNSYKTYLFYWSIMRSYRLFLNCFVKSVFPFHSEDVCFGLQTYHNRHTAFFRCASRAGCYIVKQLTKALCSSPVPFFFVKY